MFFVKVLMVVATICCTAQADLFTNIPIIGGVVGTVANASKTVLNTAVDAVQHTGEQIIHSKSILENIIANQIKKILKDLKTLMFDEITLLGLPRLEPYEHGHQDINITHEIGIFEGTLDDVVVTGLSNFAIDKVAVKIKTSESIKEFLDPNITIDLFYETLNIAGKYDIKAFVGDLFNIWGNGNFNLTMHELQINASVDILIDYRKQQIRIDEVNVNIKLGKMTCNFENLMGGGENGDLFNKVIGEVAPEALDVLWPEIRPGVEDKIKEIMVINLIPTKIRNFFDLFHVNINAITRIFGIEIN